MRDLVKCFTREILAKSAISRFALLTFAPAQELLFTPDNSIASRPPTTQDPDSHDQFDIYLDDSS
jgi:hypothetical protein